MPECFSTILVATDGSEFSAGAVRVAIDMAQRMDARLLALSALYADEKMFKSPAAAEKQATAIVGQAVAAAKAAGVKANGRVRRGDSLAGAIIAAADEDLADIIVMGRRGVRGLAKKMLGDATSKVITGASAPVLVVPKSAQPWRQRILLATDGSAAAERAAGFAAGLAGCFGLPLTVLSVEVPKHSPQRQAETAKIVEKTVADFKSRGLDAEGMVRRGAPPEEIVGALGDAHADLIVMGSEGRTGLSRLLVGSNSLEVIGRIECPVLVATAAPTPLESSARPRDLEDVATKSERTFLVVADESHEMWTALDYACRRAKATGGRVALLRVLEPPEPVMFAGPRALMREEARQAALELLRRLADHVEDELGQRPQVYLREGDATEELLTLLDAEREITMLVLGASSNPDGPRPLIAALSGKLLHALPVPLTIVPAHLSTSQIKAYS